MARQTKQDLIDLIGRIKTFNALPIKYTKVGHRLLNRSGFLPVHRYTIGPIFKGEIGMMNGVRYREGSRKTDR